MWEWFDGQEWTAYPLDESDRIERCFIEGQDVCDVKPKLIGEHPTHRISFKTTPYQQKSYNYPDNCQEVRRRELNTEQIRACSQNRLYAKVRKADRQVRKFLIFLFFASITLLQGTQSSFASYESTLSNHPLEQSSQLNAPEKAKVIF